MDVILTCQEIIDFLDDYLSGNQPPDVREKFEYHLSICPQCVDYLKSYGTTVQLVRAQRDTGGDEIPNDVPEELIQAILASNSKTGS